MSSSSVIQPEPVRRFTLIEGGPNSDRELRVVEKEFRIKATPWRLINSAFLLGMGIWKVVCAYRGHSTANALDFAVGAVWAFISYWLSLIEIEAPEIFPLLFHYDVGHLAFAISIGICFAAVSLWCFYLLFLIVEKLQNILNFTMVFPLKVLVEAVILVGTFLLIWAILWLRQVRFHGSPVGWDVTARWLGQPAYMLIFILSAVLSGAIVLSSLGALIEDIFTISEEMAFTVGFSISLVPIFIGLYLIFGFALMITRAVSKKTK